MGDRGLVMFDVARMRNASDTLRDVAKGFGREHRWNKIASTTAAAAKDREVFLVASNVWKQAAATLRRRANKIDRAADKLLTTIDAPKEKRP